MERRCTRKETYPKFPLAEVAKTMNLKAVQNLEVISPKSLEPWRQPAFKSIDIENDKKRANEKIINLINTPETVIYPDASEKKGHLGAAMIILNRYNEIKKS
jgi:hypothetical protein